IAYSTAYLEQYVQNEAQGTRFTELVLLAIWLLLIPGFALYAIRSRQAWQGQDLLLLGLLIALLSPAFPRYGRFHLSGAVPILALAGAGTVHYLIQAKSRILRAYAVVGICLSFSAFPLPTYYRLRLGPRTGEYEGLVPIGDWFRAQPHTALVTHAWILPEIDPTSNFYT